MRTARKVGAKLPRSRPRIGPGCAPNDPDNLPLLADTAPFVDFPPVS